MFRDRAENETIPTGVTFKLPYTEMIERIENFLSTVIASKIEVSYLYEMESRLHLIFNDLSEVDTRKVANFLGISPSQIEDEPDTVAELSFSRLFDESFTFLGEDPSTVSVLFSISYESYISYITGLPIQV